MAKLLTLDQMKEVTQAATVFQHLWDQARLHPRNRNKLLRHFNRMSSEWEDTFVKFLRPDTVSELRRMA
jgi:hypothetical protein